MPKNPLDEIFDNDLFGKKDKPSKPKKTSFNQESKLTRAKDGTFKDWRGGRDLSYHGLMVHLGKNFKAQTGRKAKVGDCVRDKNLDGSYNKNSVWWIKTAHGWRKARTGKKRPSKTQIKRVLESSRKGR